MVFQHSTRSEPGWPDIEETVRGTGNVLGDTIHALRILFALFYGAQLDASQVAGKKVSRAGIYHMGTVVHIVSTICAYAEYFECGEHVKQGVVRAMQSAPGYWIAVADDPKRHVMLAIPLQLHDVYWDVLRHLVAQAWDKTSSFVVDWSDVAEAMGKTEEEVRSFFEPQMEDMPNLVGKLNRDLMRLCFKPVQAYSGGWYIAFTTFTNALNVQEGRPFAYDQGHRGCPPRCPRLVGSVLHRLILRRATGNEQLQAEGCSQTSLAVSTASEI